MAAGMPLATVVERRPRAVVERRIPEVAEEMTPRAREAAGTPMVAAGWERVSLGMAATGWGRAPKGMVAADWVPPGTGAAKGRMKEIPLRTAHSASAPGGW